MSSAVPLSVLSPPLSLHPTHTTPTTTLPASPIHAARTPGTAAYTPTTTLTPTTITTTTNTNDITKPAHPDYVQTLTVRDANGTVRELVFPKGLDLDRPKRARTTFSGDQLSALEREFRRNQYLVGRERSLLAARLGLSETQVKVWYQNRRTKHKRDREREHEAPTPTAAPLTQRPTLLAPPNPVPTTTPNNNNHNAPLYTLPTPSMHPHHHHHHPLPLPPKLCTPTAPHPPTTSPLTSFPGSQEVLLGRQAPEGTEPQGNQGGSCSSPSTGAPKDPSPPRHNSPRGGVEYQMGVGVGGVEYQMGGVKFDHLESTFSKTLPTLLGSFHSVPPSFPPSAFRPLLPRPLHPLALQHHALGRPHPTWLP